MVLVASELQEEDLYLFPTFLGSFNLNHTHTRFRMSVHYRKLRLCLGFLSLPRAFSRALGTENLCREPALGTECTVREGASTVTFGLPSTVPTADPALGKGVDQGLRRLTGLCLEPAGAVGRASACADGPPSAQSPLPRAPTRLSAEK
jgi:hypothetical protein